MTKGMTKGMAKGKTTMTNGVLWGLFGEKSSLLC